MSHKDYYKILGIEKGASNSDIKRAYRKLAHEHHPDRPGGNEEKFKEINEAYQILSDDNKRKQYDQFGQSFNGGNPFGQGGNPFGGFDFNFQGGGVEDLGDLFETFFEGFGGGRRRKTYQRGSDLEISVEISLEEAHHGIDKKISFPTLVGCTTCKNMGYFGDEGFTNCHTCDGQGEVRENRTSFFGNFTQVRQCSKCQGQGKIPNKTCRECSGTGRLRDKKTIDVVISAGVHDNQLIKITGAGEMGERGSSAGDIYIRVRVKKHSVFHVEGDNLSMEKEVDMIDILLGNSVPVTLIDKSIVSLEIPAGANLNEHQILVGKGMPVLGSGSRFKKQQYGDLYISLRIKTPTKMSSKARKLLSDLKEELK